MTQKQKKIRIKMKNNHTIYIDYSKSKLDELRKAARLQFSPYQYVDVVQLRDEKEVQAQRDAGWKKISGAVTSQFHTMVDPIINIGKSVMQGNRLIPSISNEVQNSVSNAGNTMMKHYRDIGDFVGGISDFVQSLNRYEKVEE